VRLLLVVAASLLFACAVRGESFTVRIQETAVIEIAGATAAYTTNPLIADVTLAGAGRLSVTGNSSGTTQLIVISANGTQAFLITVAAASLPPTNRPEPGVPQSRYDGRYSSGTSRVQNGFDVLTTDGTRRTELHILDIHNLRTEPGRSSDAIPSIFYRITTPGRVVTLLDETVDASRLTISNTQVRGFHLTQGPLEVHAGYASSTMLDDFFLSTGRRWVAGAGYGFDLGSTRLTPSIYDFFSEASGTTSRRGVVGSLKAEHREGETFLVRGEVGVSRSIAAAGEVRYVSPRQQVRARFSLKPDDFPNLGLSEIPGGHAELEWSGRATDRLSITSYGTYDHFRLTGLRETIGAASLGLRYAATARLSFLGGADLATVRTPATSIRTIGLPLGVAYDAPAYGLAASYRLLDNSAASRHGDALRLSARAGSGPFTASAWAERQRQAPTLDLIFSNAPGLELALLRLGITVRTPEDLARALRDNAALIDLGFITGVNAGLTPRRLQAGLNLGWLGSDRASDHLRLVAVYDRDDGRSAAHDSLIATLSWSRRILTATDLYASYSWWRTSASAQQISGTSVDIGLRQQFSGLPLFLRRSGTIEGIVFLDPEMSGVPGPRTAPLPDIDITLDDTRSARTDSKGAYAFDHVPPGPHRVAAQLPASRRAFFTTPSRFETKGPAHADFGLVWAAARIDGRVISDAGIGLAGAVLSAGAPKGTPITTTTDNEGRFVFAVPPGTFRIELAAESLPAGYSIAEGRERNVTAEPDKPQPISFAVRAIRSISGRAAGASEVRIESLDRTVPVDQAGNFVFRSMPSGTFTITGRSGARTLSRTVTMPAEPTLMSAVDLGAPSSGTAFIVSPPPAVSVVERLGTFQVQAGAFREAQNAIQLVGRLQRSGEQPFTIAARGLTRVYIGPFASLQDAVAANDRLRRAGIDGFTTRR
jgi:hypothetical protein